MKISSSLILALCWLGLSAQNDTINPDGFNRFYYPSGKISSEGNLLNGKPDGVWKAFYENGSLKSVGERKNNKPQGSWKFYNEKNQLTAEYLYVDGLKEGWQKEYFENGKIKSEEFLKDNLKEDTARYFDDRGFLHKTVPFKNNLEQGLAIEYASDGRVITLTDYDRGYLKKEEKINRIDKFGLKQGVWKEFYDGNLAVKSEGKYSDDRKDGLFKTYKKDGTLIKTELYRNGELFIDKLTHKELTIDRDYYNNGRPKSSVNLLDGIKQGVYREYDRNGNITAGKIYRDDKVIAEGITDGGGKKTR